MSVDDTVKLIAVTGLTVSILGISVQLMRLIGELVNHVKELKRVSTNLGTITDGFVKEQKMLDEILENAGSIVSSVKNMIEKFRNDVVGPLVDILSVVKRVSRWTKRSTVERE